MMNTLRTPWTGRKTAGASAVTAVALILSIATSPVVQGSDWKNWRGPSYNGTSDETEFRKDFGRRGPEILWKASIGMGYSGMVVSDGLVYTMGLTGSTETVFCFEARTGKKVWTHEWPSTFEPKYYDGGTSGTPTVIGDRVYLLAQTGEVFCFDAKTGRVQWEVNIKDKLGLEVGTWGFTSAPFHWKNSIILNAGKNGVAMDRATGEILWSSGTDANGYATAVPFTHAGREAVAIFSAKALNAVDPDSGRLLWSYPWETSYDVNAADPLFIEGDRVLISSGYGSGAALLKLGSGKPDTLWKNKNLHTQLNAAVYHEGYFYGIDGNTTDKATLNCLKASNGEVVWKQQGIGTGGLILADRHLIVISERGELMIAPASPEGFNPTVRRQLYGGKTWTVPTLADSIVYCRNSRGDLVAVSLK
jgi:outer membrane protein assembly factor BamB